MRQPIGLLIKQRRLQADLTQETLAKTLNVTKATISNIEKQESVARNEFETVIKLLYVLGIDHTDAIDFSGLLVAPGVEESSTKYAPKQLPVLNYVQAGAPAEFFDDYQPGAGMYSVPIDGRFAETLSEYSFGLEIQGDSMTPTYKEGEQVVIDPEKNCKPGDVVVAKLDNQETAVLKKYRPRGLSDKGIEIIELTPENDDYPIITIDENTFGKLVGPVVAHIRRPRS